MINVKYSIALAIPLLLSGCVIIDADSADLRSVSVIHEPGENSKAAFEADERCADYGLEARLVEVEDADEDGKVRSLYNCR